MRADNCHWLRAQTQCGKQCGKRTQCGKQHLPAKEPMLISLKPELARLPVAPGSLASCKMFSRVPSRGTLHGEGHRDGYRGTHAATWSVLEMRPALRGSGSSAGRSALW